MVPFSWQQGWSGAYKHLRARPAHSVTPFDACVCVCACTMSSFPPLLFFLGGRYMIMNALTNVAWTAVPMLVSLFSFACFVVLGNDCG